MNTTAAGHLISPQGREIVRGEAYVQRSTSPRGPERQRLMNVDGDLRRNNDSNPAGVASSSPCHASVADWP